MVFSFLTKSLNSTSSATEVKQPPRADEESTTDSPSDERTELIKSIVQTWKTVWDGLIQTHSGQGSYRINDLQKLYLGAGTSYPLFHGRDGGRDETIADESTVEDADVSVAPRRRTKGEFKGIHVLHLALSGAVSQYATRNTGCVGLERVRVYPGISVTTLSSLLDVLRAFEREIDGLRAVYALLRKLQVGLREPTREDFERVKRDLPRVVEPVGARLLHYLARLDVLGIDMEDEWHGVVAAAEEESERVRVASGGKDKGKVKTEEKDRPWFVKDEVYPKIRGNKSLFSMGASGRGL